MASSLQGRSQELITMNSPKSPVSEAYRSIRTNLTFLNPDDPLETILVTSSGAGEGKSLTTANIAVTLAQNGQETIIIDADLRKPMQHRFFEMTNFEGLSNILTGEIEFEEGLRETGIEDLRIISTGIIPPNPADLLASKKMEDVLQKARERADMVIVDTPPAIAVTDASILGNKVDGVVIVVAHNQTPEEMLVKAQERLERAKARVVGVVLNKYPVHQESSYYNEYYYYYGRKKKG